MSRNGRLKALATLPVNGFLKILTLRFRWLQQLINPVERRVTDGFGVISARVTLRQSLEYD